jgi:hypothetical protein
MIALCPSFFTALSVKPSKDSLKGSEHLNLTNYENWGPIQVFYMLMQQK